MGLELTTERPDLHEHHVDERDQEVGGAVLAEGRVVEVGPVQHPLDEDHEDQVAEDEEEEDQLGDELEPDFVVAPSCQIFSIFNRLASGKGRTHEKKLREDWTM